MKRDFVERILDGAGPVLVFVGVLLLVSVLIYIDREQYGRMEELSFDENAFLVLKVVALIIIFVAFVVSLL